MSKSEQIDLPDPIPSPRFIDEKRKRKRKLRDKDG